MHSDFTSLHDALEHSQLQVPAQSDPSMIPPFKLCRIEICFLFKLSFEISLFFIMTVFMCDLYKICINNMNRNS